MIEKNRETELEIQECFVNEKTNIIQSNYLIERKQKLSLPATQLLFTLTGMINRDDEDLKEYRVDVRHFANLWKIDLKLAYQSVTGALLELRKKGINQHSVNPKNGKKIFKTVGFISYGEYEQGSGYATVQIHPKLKPHYIALKKEFTRFSLNNILQLQENGAQVNTLRTYEILKQYQKIGFRKISVLDYKEQLGLVIYDKNGNPTKEKYKSSNTNLKTFVLEPAKEKINECTDIEIDYEIIGRGNKASINFTIRKNTKNKTVSLNENDKQTFDSFEEEQNDIALSKQKLSFDEETVKNVVKLLSEIASDNEMMKHSPEEIKETLLKALNGELEENVDLDELGSEDGFDDEPEDYSQTPLERSFRDEDEKRAYIEGYLDTHFTDKVCKEYLVDVIPEDVHGYDEEKVEAIKNVAMQYVTFEQTSESSGIDRMMQWHTNLRKAVEAYTKQKWLPNHQYKVQKDVLSYFTSCFGYWLMDNSERFLPDVEEPAKSFNDDEFFAAAVEKTKRKRASTMD